MGTSPVCLSVCLSTTPDTRLTKQSRVVGALAASRSLVRVYLQQRAPLPLPLPERAGATRAERMELGARGYVQDIVAGGRRVRAVGVAYSPAERPFVYRVVEGAVRRAAGRGAFWGEEVFPREEWAGGAGGAGGV